LRLQSFSAFCKQFLSQALPLMGWIDGHISELGLIHDVMERRETRHGRAHPAELDNQNQSARVAG
jgi:hypothetical protein